MFTDPASPEQPPGSLLRGWVLEPLDDGTENMPVPVLMAQSYEGQRICDDSIQTVLPAQMMGHGRIWAALW